MGRSWAFVLVFLLAAAFFNLASVKAIEPEVTILPDDRIISVDSDLVVKVDPKISGTPVRITWSVFNTGYIGVGSFPMVGGNGVCYFSNDDENATCGPSPFFQTGETELSVFVVTSFSTTTAINKSIPINVSSVSIRVDEVFREDNKVFMYIYTPQFGLMRYSIYKEDLSIYQSERQLVYNGARGRYEGNITLNPGVYYFTFVGVNGSSTYGSALKRIEIPSADFLTVQTDRKDYWRGAKIRISGSSSGEVVGEVRFPNGNKVDFTADAGPDNTYYYDLDSAASWPEGAYEIRTSRPLVKTATFNMTDFLEVNPASVSETVNKSGDFSKSLTLKNTRQNATNVSFTVSGGILEQHVTIANKSLNPQQATTLTIAIQDVESSIEGAIKLKTTEGLEVVIPVKVTAVEPGQEGCVQQVCTGAKALEIDQDSLVWSQECMAGDSISHTVKIKNVGADTLSNFQYEVEDSPGYGQSLESLDGAGNVEIYLSGVSIEAGASEEIDIAVTPSSSGKYEGLIKLKSGGEAAFILVSLNCFENINGSLSTVAEKLADLKPAKEILDDINSDISNAENDLALGNYAQANEYTVKAQAKINMLERGGGGVPGQPMDLTWIIIIIVIAVVVVVFFLFFRSRKPKASGFEEGTEELESFG